MAGCACGAACGCCAAGGPGPILDLPTLPAGWVYEGWVVGPDGPVTTGRFTMASGADSDGDGIPDSIDAFSSDTSEFADSDGDGIGNHADTDDDNDGVIDSLDGMPLDATETLDSDGDGVGDNADAFPLDATESVDTDGDGTGNHADTDDDNDNVLDINDAFPLDASESLDTDGDGVGEGIGAHKARWRCVGVAAVWVDLQRAALIGRQRGPRSDRGTGTITNQHVVVGITTVVVGQHIAADGVATIFGHRSRVVDSHWCSVVGGAVDRNREGGVVRGGSVAHGVAERFRQGLPSIERVNGGIGVVQCVLVGAIAIVGDSDPDHVGEQESLRCLGRCHGYLGRLNRRRSRRRCGSRDSPSAQAAPVRGHRCDHRGDRRGTRRRSRARRTWSGGSGSRCRASEHP